MDCRSCIGQHCVDLKPNDTNSTSRVAQLVQGSTIENWEMRGVEAQSKCMKHTKMKLKG